MGSQFFTAVGAFVGTFLGIWIAETSGTGSGVALKEGEGFFGTSVGGGELVIPMTAGGGFLYYNHDRGSGDVRQEQAGVCTELSGQDTAPLGGLWEV